MWLILLGLGAIGIGYAVSRTHHTDSLPPALPKHASDTPIRARKEIDFMAAQLRNAGATWGIFKPSDLVSALPQEFMRWDLVATTTKDDGSAAFDRLMTAARAESPGAAITLRLFGFDDVTGAIADSITTDPGQPSTTGVSGAPSRHRGHYGYYDDRGNYHRG